MKTFMSVVILLALAAVSADAFVSTSNIPLNPFMKFLNLEHETPTLRSIVKNSLTQRVDNFDPQNQDTFVQQYYMNGEFFQPGGPIIILLGGFDAISFYRLHSSMPLNVARELFGYVFYLEHRFFGESIPTPNLITENLRFLTPDQALADIAHFITHIKSSVVTPGAQNSPVIVVGSQYAGNLAVWFRQKYPHLALAAWASSAPVQSVVNHYQYKETAAATYRSIGGDECYDALERSFDYLDDEVAAGNLNEMVSIFNICDNSVLSTERSIGYFMQSIAEVFSIIPQVATVRSIDGVCRVLQAPAETPAHALYNVLNINGGGEGPEGDWCLELNYTMIVEWQKQTELDAFGNRIGLRQNLYYTCTQLGWHHTSDSPNQPFGHRFGLNFWLELCEDVFETAFSNFTLHAESDRINVAHGGVNPQVTNVIFTHGELDPWRTIGVLEELNEDAPVIIMAGTSQSQDMYELDEDDSQEVTEAKIAVKGLIRNWIARDQGVVVEPL